MTWHIEFRPKADKAFRRLDKVIQNRITAFMLERVAKHPDPLSLAERLYGKYDGLWRFRIGDYRVICEIEEEIITIFVFAIGHRREIYH